MDKQFEPIVPNESKPIKHREKPIEEGRETRVSIEHTLVPVIARKEQKLRELSAKREAKELSPHDFDLNYIFQLNQAGLPLTRKDMQHETGNQALVITRDDLETVRYLNFIHSSGERMVIEPESLDPNDVFILYSHEVGDEERMS